MDLDDFEKAANPVAPTPLRKTPTASDAVRYIDAAWYTHTNRRGRWMDLIGDYAGSELFVLDGEALCQEVLNDPLLALGRQDESSFQILHAIYSLERILKEFKMRSATFEVVFWQGDTRHLTLQTGTAEYIQISRGLARVVLSKHLRSLDIPIHTFDNLSDPEWLNYQRLTKPMFVMTNDGGLLETDSSSLSAERLLVQRVFVFDLLAQGVSIALLHGAEHRDSKILTFVYESRLDPSARKCHPKQLWSASDVARKALEAQEYHVRHDNRVLPLATFAPQSLRSSKSNALAWLPNFMTRVSSTLHLAQPATGELLYAFAAHLLIVPTLSAEERGQSLTALHPSLKGLVVDSFLPVTLLILEDVSVRHLPDVDGHIFIALLNFLMEHAGQMTGQLIGVQVSTELDAIWSSCGFGPPDFKALASRFPQPRSLPQSSHTVAVIRPPLPFNHPVFDEHLEAVYTGVESEDAEEVAHHLSFNTIFNDVYHWHNHKRAILPAHLGGEPKQVMDERQRMKALRRTQHFMASMEQQAQTLTGVFGIPLVRMIILPVNSRAQRPRARVIEDRPSQPSKKGKKEHISSADKIRLSNMEKKQAKMDDSNETWWKDQLAILTKSSLSHQITRVEDLQRNKRTWEGWLAVEARLYRLHLEFVQWIEDDNREDASVRDRHTVGILRMVKDIYQQSELFPAAAEILVMTMNAIGLSSVADDLKPSSPVNSSVGRSLSFKFAKLQKSKTKSLLYKFMLIQEDPIVWQLRLFGEYMDRSMDSQSDPRVPFKPDAWQRKVLDCLDANHSILVVAPTSAGKTFISYYAMEQVLKQSDDGILVYIAPTKALVNQIAAEVYARYKKDLNGRSCWAIHTRDYRINDPQKCQILVTVPEMLAIMLLSPPLARIWTPRIKRIILDEIHCIGQQDGGAVWEQILLYAPCPIIGLSATIGHPEQFNEWLQSVQEAHHFKHTFIHHPHRYSHLRKFSYTLQPKPSTSFQGLTNYTNTSRMRLLHPVSMLSFGARELPPDFSLEAADCLSLHAALLRCSHRIPMKLESLDPARFFSSRNVRLLRQQDVLEYDSALKTVLSRLLADADARDERSALQEVVGWVTDPVVKGISHNAIPTAKDFKENLIYFVSDLHVNGDLPAILFNFDRKVCEAMCQTILDRSEKAEKNWRESSPEWARKISQWELWKAQSKARTRQAERQARRPKDLEEIASADMPTSWESSFNPNEPSPEFSFASISSAYSKSDLEEEIYRLNRWSTVPKWALKALRRGVGVHHAGMNKRYRTLLESLFRLGVVRVVIATGTLALGINAPTKTSVFCGDSPYLTALQFRQCAGRAGRRGFDLLGKVIFYGLAMDRCQRLVLSRLPSLGGNFPLTATMVLRLFNLLQGSDGAPVARKAIGSLFTLPHVGFKSEVGKEQITHFMRFSIDYLRRAGLLDSEGNPINLFGVASHLYYTEPGNLALVALLRRGVIHRICCQPSQTMAKWGLLMLLCHLFGRRYLPSIYATDENLQHLVKKSPSMVMLPPLPDDARAVLQDHDSDILSVFTSYALAYTAQHLSTDDRLPISGLRISSCDAVVSPFQTHLQQCALRPVARSSFVANSGHDDQYQTVEELTRTARDGLHLNQYAIPSMHQLTAEPSQSGKGYALNAYILDFYVHGQPAALNAANGIRPNDMWYLLEDFTLTLKTIRAGLGQLLLEASAEGVAAEQGEDEDIVDVGNDDWMKTTDGEDVVLEEAAEGDDDDDDEKLNRPPGVSDNDWVVYKIVDAVTTEFEEKFKAIWA